MKSTPGAITLASGSRSRYKLEIFPRIWLKSDKPSLWSRLGYLIFFGKSVVKLPPIETCSHTFEVKEHLVTTNGTTKMESYNFCPRCEVEEAL